MLRSKEYRKTHAGIENNFFVVFSSFLLLCGDFCHPEHKTADADDAEREDQRFVFASPAVDLSGQIIMGGNTFRKEGKGNNGYNKGKEH